MIELTVHLPRPHPAQREVLATASRFNVLVMGRRWGKTKLALRRLARRALHGEPVGWFAPTYKLLDEVWHEANQRLSPVLRRRDGTAKRLELLGGGTWDFWTLDESDAGRGRKYAEVVIDEAAMVRGLRERWQQAIRPTLTDLLGSAWFLSTPRGLNDFYDLFRQAENREDWMRWQMPTHRNPYISPAELEAARAELPATVYAQEYLAEFVDLQGGRVRREWLRYAEPAVPLPVVLGVDLAISARDEADYTAVCALSRDSEGRIFVRDVQRVQAGFYQVLQFIEGMAARWKPTAIAIEQVQYQAAVVQELLRRTQLPVKGVRPDRDKLTRFQPLEARYEQGLIYHSPTLPREFEDELLSFPNGVHDDTVDALSYAFGQLSTPRLSNEATHRLQGW
jgi:predicted phage terminase large subunit-like protein